MSPIRVEPAGPGCCLLSLLLLPLRILFFPFIIRFTPYRARYPRRWQ
jgi:hypothetical protein